MNVLIDNQIKPEFTSSSGVHPYDIFNSAARKNMHSSSHLGQALVLENCTTKRSFTGMEREFGRFTFNIKFPCDAQIIAIIPKYENTLTQSFAFNPTTLIIYENLETQEFGILECIYHSQSIDSKHQHFGYKFDYRDLDLYEGKKVRKGTIVGDSPTKTEGGEYRYGIEANIAFMGLPGIIEDGIIVSESFARRLKTYGFEKRYFGWGNAGFPLNTYPEKGKYKVFPDIGEELRSDGLLVAMRPWDYLLGPVDLAPQSLATPDYSFDKVIFGEPGARGLEHLTPESKEKLEQAGTRVGSSKVVDINVWHNDSLNTPLTPVQMEEQPRKYHDNLKRYHRRIIETYQRLYKAYKDDIKLTSEFHRQVVESMGFFTYHENPITKHYKSTGTKKSHNVNKVYRDQKIEEWLVEITYQYEVVPSYGAKLTDSSGNCNLTC